MRFRLHLLSLLGAGLLALPAIAQTPEKPADEPPQGGPAMKQKLLDNFDTNKDGTLDHQEARAIGRALRENFDVGPPGDRGPEGRRRPDGPPRGEGRGPEGRRGRGPGRPEDGDRGPGDRGPRGPRDGRGPEGFGRGGPGGRPPGPPNPERLFNRFDENEDGSLSLEEFTALTHHMRERMAMGPPMGRGPGFERGRGPEGRGFDGPPRDGERRGGKRGEGRPGGRRGGPPPGPDGPSPADPPADVAPKNTEPADAI